MGIVHLLAITKDVVKNEIFLEYGDVENEGVANEEGEYEANEKVA